MKLTDTQQAVISDINHSLLVTAPAGTGKTEVMARRAAFAREQGKKHILCLTFTNRAANSMKKRIQSLIPQSAGVTVCTVHAFCNMLIRAESKTLGLPYGYSIIDEEDSVSVLRGILPSQRELSDHDIKAAMSMMEDFRLKHAMGRDPSGNAADKFASRFSIDLDDAVKTYLSYVSESGSLDFLSLITTVYQFLEEPDNLARWQQVYDMIQVDEMQDTGVIEYTIISKLAGKHRNLSLFGDTDQTIYEWRDSRPFEIIADFEKQFSPISYILSHNFRSTGHITLLAEEFLAAFFNTEQDEVAVSRGEGEMPGICFLNNSVYEKKQINRIIQKLHNQGSPFNHIAVLTRTNKDARDYSLALNDAGIPCYVIDEYNFFRREEIKDALAVCRLLLNRNDTSSARRVLTKFAKQIGDKTISDILNSTLPVTLADFMFSSHSENADILQPVFDAYHQNRMVVFDVESTGLNTEADEIIEIAAVRIDEDGMDEFHAYIQNTIPVGASQAVHGYTDEFLKGAGHPAEKVLNDFLGFAKGCMLCGHNVAYDISILKSELARLNIDYPLSDAYFDTMDGAKRILPDADNYKLGTLCAHFGIEETPTHHAMDDVWATLELLEICIEGLEETTEERILFYDRYRDKFAPFSKVISDIKTKSQTLRPGVLLAELTNALEIKDHYARVPAKQQNLDELAAIFNELDDTALRPEAALRRITELLTLSNSVERQIIDADKVAVLTVHQAKGLQFDAVIIANAVEGAFPSKLNIKYEQFDEEARLFYVAMTRASEHLFITLSALDDNGRQNASSRFIKYLSKAHYEKFIQEPSGS